MTNHPTTRNVRPTFVGSAHSWGVPHTQGEYVARTPAEMRAMEARMPALIGWESDEGWIPVGTSHNTGD